MSYIKTNILFIPSTKIIRKVKGLGFATRDHGAKNEEDQGLLEFTTIKNDG